MLNSKLARVEDTIMGDSNKCNTLEELLCLLWRDRTAVNIAETVAALEILD